MHSFSIFSSFPLQMRIFWCLSHFYCYTFYMVFSETTAHGMVVNESAGQGSNLSVFLANLSTDHHSWRWESNKTKCNAVKMYNYDCIITILVSVTGSPVLYLGSDGVCRSDLRTVLDTRSDCSECVLT